MDSRTELEQLRKLKRLQELEARSATTSAVEEPKPESIIEKTPSERAQQAISGLKQMGYFDEEQANRALQNTLGVMAGGGLTKSIPALAQGVGSVVAPWLEGGAIGAASSPDDRLRGLLTGASTQGVLTNAGQALGKLGDIAMQVGVGRKKYTPGVGTRLADEGLIGTRGMMRKQVANRLSQRGQEMENLVKNIPEIDSAQIGKEILEETTSPLTGGGLIKPSARDIGTISDLQSFADDVMARGLETGPQALARRRAAGSSAYSQRTGDPKLAPLAQASKLEQAKYSEALKSADPTGQLTDVDAAYAALKRGERALSEEAPLTGLGILSRPTQVLGGAPLMTGLGQAATKAKPTLEEFLAPILRQSVINK